MSTSVKVAGFVVAVAAVFGAALGVGRAVGPVGDAVATSHGSSHADGGNEHGADHGDQPSSAYSSMPGGLMATQDGYSLVVDPEGVQPGTGRPVSFTITGPDGAPVRDYDVKHEKELHLIAVRRDLTGFQHVHPTRDDAGIWSTALDLTPGSWRVFADFTAAGAEALTLGADLAVPGGFTPAAPRPESRVATVGRYQVTLAGDLTAGADAELTLKVTRDGKPVTDLEPYLGAYGHLVALRGSDLAYLHVHPDGSPGDGETEPGPEVTFYAAVPSAGTYHLYLDFKHAGVVRTAAFVLLEGADASGNAPGRGAHSGHDSH